MIKKKKMMMMMTKKRIRKTSKTIKTSFQSFMWSRANIAVEYDYEISNKFIFVRCRTHLRSKAMVLHFSYELCASIVLEQLEFVWAQWPLPESTKQEKKCKHIQITCRVSLNVLWNMANTLVYQLHRWKSENTHSIEHR